MRFRSWLCAMIGAWFIVSPWWMGVALRREAAWTSVAVGAIQVIAAITATAGRDDRAGRTWQTWVLMLTGFWFLVQPFLGHYEVDQYWATVGPAMLTLVLVLWTLMNVKVPDDDTGDKGPRGRVGA